jgi:glycerol-3-phosphate acyltransferase PlsY
MNAIITYLSSISPILATAIIVAIVVWWAAKFFHKISALQLRTDEKFAHTEAKINSIKENDLYHISKAILLLAKTLIPEDKKENFERIKDTLLESAPENRRDEIKSITI